MGVWVCRRIEAGQKVRRELRHRDSSHTGGKQEESTERHHEQCEIEEIAAPTSRFEEDAGLVNAFSRMPPGDPPTSS